MSVEALPVGQKCNLSCTYCYEEPLRELEVARPFDFDAMSKTLRAEVAAGRKGEGFTVFGGEPLLLALDDLEKFLALSFELAGKSGVQTNGALIRPHHFPLFEKYRTHVGISIDGPGALNDARWNGTLERTRAATEDSNDALRECLKRGVGTSLILTLNHYNAGDGEKLDALIEWLSGLAKLGLRDVRAHLMEVDRPVAEALVLDTERNVRAFRALHRLEASTGLRFDVFKDVRALLRGADDGVTCTWNACDPAFTGAVRGVGPRGERLNCGRTNKDGVPWRKVDAPSYRRQLVLASTPQSEGGCQGCRFFVACKGQCPGEAIDGDPRNRSRYCDTWFATFSFFEARLVDVGEMPVSLRPDLARVEAEMLDGFEVGVFVSVKRAIARAEGRERWTGATIPDVAHGDEHGDHTDHGGGDA